MRPVHLAHQQFTFFSFFGNFRGLRLTGSDLRLNKTKPKVADNSFFFRHSSRSDVESPIVVHGDVSAGDNKRDPSPSTAAVDSGDQVGNSESERDCWSGGDLSSVANARVR